MSYVVTAASGHLGRLVVEALLGRGVAASDIVATSRDPQRIADFAARGVRTEALDYTNPDSISRVLTAGDRVLLVSGAPGDRVTEHRNVIDAATAAGVDQLAYTSAGRATEVDFALAPDHKATEEAITAAGLPAVILRNVWYTENFEGDLRQAAATGEVASSTGEGRIASASRGDYAEVAAAVLTGEGHVGQVYDLGGPSWTYTDLAAALTDVLGREVTYRLISDEEQLVALRGAGLPEPVAQLFTAVNAGIRVGALSFEDRSLERILGRPATPIRQTLGELAAAAGLAG